VSEAAQPGQDHGIAQLHLAVGCTKLSREPFNDQAVRLEGPQAFDEPFK
jgi:hypothetical protein